MGHDKQEQQEQATMPGSSLRAAVYVRISDDPEGTERGVDRQEADCRAYAAAHGWEVVAVFRENDTSAFKQRTITLPSGERVRRVIRPEFRTMLRHLADGQAQVMHGYDATGTAQIAARAEVSEPGGAAAVRGRRTPRPPGKRRRPSDRDQVRCTRAVAGTRGAAETTTPRLVRTRPPPL